MWLIAFAASIALLIVWILWRTRGRSGDRSGSTSRSINANHLGAERGGGGFITGG
jgi:hypothetical protein